MKFEDLFKEFCEMDQWGPTTIWGISYLHDLGFSFDAIFCDEAQNIDATSKDWLKCFLRNEESCFYSFGDLEQKTREVWSLFDEEKDNISFSIKPKVTIITLSKRVSEIRLP